MEKLKDKLNNDWTYSYSGADCKAYAYFNVPEYEVIPLSSLATLSVSIHEAKSPVRRLGERGVSGYTRGIRTVAGSMVFVIVKGHPLKQLAMLDPITLKKSYEHGVYLNDRIDSSFSSDIEEKGTFRRDSDVINKLSTTISPFNVLLNYQSEVSLNSASFTLIDVEIINEGLVTSVNDMVSEVVVQFVAKDIKPFVENTDVGKKVKEEEGSESDQDENEVESDTNEEVGPLQLPEASKAADKKFNIQKDINKNILKNKNYNSKFNPILPNTEN